MTKVQVIQEIKILKSKLTEIRENVWDLKLENPDCRDSRQYYSGEMAGLNTAILYLELLLERL